MTNPGESESSSGAKKLPKDRLCHIAGREAGRAVQVSVRCISTES